MKIISKSLVETEKFAQDFVTKLTPKKDEATLVAFSGELGSGKTTFVQFAAKQFGVSENITSPTFVIMKKFPIPNSQFLTLFHIDAYRLESGEELAKLGFEEIVANPNNLIFLEWPENVAEVLPGDYLTIKFSFIDEATRAIECRKI